MSEPSPGSGPSEDLGRKVAALLSALEKLPARRGVSFRGRSSAEERVAWFAAREASSAERFSRAEPGPVNPQKAADYPHLRRVLPDPGADRP